jgi:hypothetical protein
MDLQNESHSFNRYQSIKILSIAFFLLTSNGVFAQGDLLLFPKRLVFEGRNRVEQITLVNSGKDSATYNISFVQYRMTETGDFETITEPDFGQRFATPFLRFFPRKVDLAPGESQNIKIQVINSEKMEDGEYRSHLYFRAENNNKPLGRENSAIDTSAISVQLEAVFGIAIATIIRKGKSTANVSISDVEYNKDSDSNSLLSFSFNRTGNMSTYGDITINYISRENKSFEVGLARGVAVYTPGNVRKVKMLLQKPPDVDFNGGIFKVVYTQNEGKTVLAEAELKL